MDERLVSMIDFYRSTSKRNHQKIKVINEKLDELIHLPNKFLLGDDYDGFYTEYHNQKDTHLMTFIVFQAMAIEAFLNEYIYLRLGKLYFESLDKLSPADKLLVACKMITGKDFSKESHAYCLLVKTIKHRNELVHFKSEKKHYFDSISEQDINDISITYDKIVEELNSLDTSFDPKYLKPIEDDFWNKEY